MKKITLLMITVLMTISLQAQNKLLSRVDESYNNSIWEKSYGTNYEYDSNNNLISEISYQWENGAWQNSSKTTQTYNSENKVTQDIYLSWNSTNNLFENSSKSNYTYVGNKLTEFLSQEWENSSWVNESKSEVAYNANNLPEIIISYEWDGSQWNYDFRSTYTYNANNKISTGVSEKWNGSQWVNDSKTLYTYANNKLITERGADWDAFNNIWVATSGSDVDYEWDSAGNCKVIKEYYSSNNTTSHYRATFTYDTTKLMSSFANPFKDKTGFDFLFEVPLYENKVLTSNSSNYNANTNDYSVNGRTTYNYESAITLGTETFGLLGAAIQVYPNPAKDLLSIKNESNSLIESIRISDVTGKVILHQNQNTTQINIQNLSKGMYFLELFVEGNKETKKFIKE